MGNLSKRVNRIEDHMGLGALHSYQKLPAQSWPSWALASLILQRRVSIQEMEQLWGDEDFWRGIEGIANADRDEGI